MMQPNAWTNTIGFQPVYGVAPTMPPQSIVGRYPDFEPRGASLPIGVEPCGLGADDPAVAAPSPTIPAWNYYVSTAATLALAYHGYKRDKSIGYAVLWGLVGGIFWPIAVPIALAQGFGKPAKG